MLKIRGPLPARATIPRRHCTVWLWLFERQNGGGAGTVEFLTDGEQEIQHIVGVDETRKLV